MKPGPYGTASPPRSTQIAVEGFSMSYRTHSPGTHGPSPYSTASYNAFIRSLRPLNPTRTYPKHTPRHRHPKALPFNVERPQQQRASKRSFPSTTGATTMRRFAAVLLVPLALACGDDSPTDVEEPTNSRENPAAPGETMTVQAGSVISGEATIRLTYLRYVRGAAALDTVIAANQFNDEPPAGHEYLLARVRVEVESVAGTEAFEMWGGDWEAFSVDALLYPDALFEACCLEATLEREAFAGASWEGWVPFFVGLGDGDPTAVYQRGGSGETWFALRP